MISFMCFYQMLVELDNGSSYFQNFGQCLVIGGEKQVYFDLK